MGAMYNAASTGAVFSEENCRGLCDAAQAMRECMGRECDKGTQIDGGGWKGKCNEFQLELDDLYGNQDGADLCNGWCDMECEGIPEVCLPIPGAGAVLAIMEGMGMELRVVFCVVWALVGCLLPQSTMRQRLNNMDKEDVEGNFCKNLAGVPVPIAPRVGV